LRHSLEKVWQALTDPAHLREWAPFTVGGSLGTVGTVKLTWVGAPKPIETRVTRADAPKVLEYSDTRWELEAFAGGTRLTLCYDIDRRFIAWGTAGWHIAFDVLDRLLGGQPIGRIVDADAMKFAGWQRLYVRFFAGVTSSLPFRSSAMFIARLTRFQTTPDLLGLFSFLCWPFRDFGCGKVMSFGGLFRNGPFRRNGATRGRGNAP